MVTVLYICFMLLVGNQSVGCYTFRISIVVFVAQIFYCVTVLCDVLAEYYITADINAVLR